MSPDRRDLQRRDTVRRAVALRAMELARLDRRVVDRFRTCGTLSWMMYNPSTQEARISTNHCWHSLCPRCSRIRQVRLQDRLSPFLRRHSNTHRIRHFVLTLRSTDNPIRAEVARLRQAFRRLRQQVNWRQRVEGGAAFVECTYNRSGGGWHPHLHIIAEGSYYPHDELSSDWRKATGDSYVVYVRHVPTDVERLAGYVAKYASKGCDPLRIPADRLAEWLRDGPRGRLWTTFGSWYNALPSQSPDADRWDGWIRVDDLDVIWRAARDGHPGSIWLLERAGIDTEAEGLAPIDENFDPAPLDNVLGPSEWSLTLPEQSAIAGPDPRQGCLGSHPTRGWEVTTP